jgi:hypothetical protein
VYVTLVPADNVSPLTEEGAQQASPHAYVKELKQQEEEIHTFTKEADS